MLPDAEDAVPACGAEREQAETHSRFTESQPSFGMLFRKTWGEAVGPRTGVTGLSSRAADGCLGMESP